MDKKLNTLTLSGLMIGPILGSGIVLLPPIAIKTLGQHAIVAWIIMMFLGGIFAYIFAKMSLLTCSNEGISSIISREIGFFPGQLASNFLTLAVCFGPVAVVVTAAEFIHNMFLDIPYLKVIIAFIFLILATFVLLMDVAKIGKLSLILSSLTALLLVIGGLFSLITQPAIFYPAGLPKISSMGYTLLLLSWAIIGWEVIGNYIEDVENPQVTIMRAMKISLSAVVLVYLISTFALQNKINFEISGQGTDVNMGMILVPIFGEYSFFIIGTIAAGLCFCTFIMFVGATSRQVAKRAENGTLPQFFKQKKGEKSPKTTLFILAGLHALILVFIYCHWITLEAIVSIANTFFICNALLGLLASFKCVKGILVKLFVTILIIIFCLLLTYSSLIAWILFIAVTLGSALKCSKAQFSQTL
ncbi:APC family permease [Cellulosilyticum sp. I15G10I2]|uniref:APC family permease n=1 Tax=Cellulosilyticum sp. I15G10I2 TaxID=1892843 RepID=UPI00085CA1BF|nr:APC family permease [Cellulosilyticum sp. I15G10I2]